MRMLKLVIWDLDETILTGILEEGDEEINPAAAALIQQLDERGILQALATQNPPELIAEAVERFNWSSRFVYVEADLGPKARKVRRILEALDINPVDTVFIDEDAFERDSIAVQFAGMSSWRVADLQTYLTKTEDRLTEEARRRPQMYREQQSRVHEEETSDNYEEFLSRCNIRLTIRPYAAADAARAEELLSRTHRMNLGILPVAEAVTRLNRPAEHSVIVAEMKDGYGDMGRVGLLHLTPNGKGEAIIESLAISCRTRARGLSLAMLVGLLRHPQARFERYQCRYQANGSNRPLRMLLMAAGFQPVRGTEWLSLTAEDLAKLQLPEWVNLEYQESAVSGAEKAGMALL